MADPGNRERGLKAALSNPRVSEQAKERDRKILVTEFGEHFEETPDDAASIEPDREMSSEPSDEYEQIAPARARQTTGLHVSSSHSGSLSKTDKMSASDTIQLPSGKMRDTRRLSTGASQGQIDGKDAANVYAPLLVRKVPLSDTGIWDSIRGLKSAINNPNVSEQAKEKDRKKLRELGEAVE